MHQVHATGPGEAPIGRMRLVRRDDRVVHPAGSKGTHSLTIQKVSRMNAQERGHLSLHFHKDLIAAFFPLLQQGFYIEFSDGNIQHLLCRICEMSPDDLRCLIQTLFLNGKPVDNMAKVYVRDGDCLALSAAMPGLVGATMRSGGPLASFQVGS